MAERRHPNRVVRDHDSSWNGKGYDREVMKHSRNGPEVTGGPKPKKNKKKWCKGKVGREHTPVGAWKEGWRNYMCVYACTGCGKELDWYFETRWFGARSKPDWVPKKPT